MSQQQTPVVQQQHSKTPTTPPAPSAPIALDPNLLSRICGGASCSSTPIKIW